jgi:hypothetical protein
MGHNGKLSGATSSEAFNDVGSVLHTRLKASKDFRLLSLVGTSSSNQQLKSWNMETFTVGHPSCPPYKALSYTWDSPIFHAPGVLQGVSQTIMCNGLEVSVGQNLYDALEQLARSGFQGHIWIDALCINQDDNDERSSQIPLMGDIYAEAVEVIVWLGKDDRFLGDLMWILNQNGLLSRAWQYMQRLDLEATQKLLFPVNERTTVAQDLLAKWQGVWKFFECRRWFTRAWIVQEIILARDIIIWCANSQLPYTQVDSLLKLLRGSGTLGLLHRWADPANGEASPNLLFRLGSNRDSCQNGLPYDDTGELRTTHPEEKLEASKFHAYALRLLNVVRTHRATKNEDKVYCFVGILERFRPTDVPAIIVPDYTLTVKEVYSSFTFAMVERLPALKILSIVEDKRHRQMKDLPSWVPDYTYSSETFSALAVTTMNCQYNPLSRQPHAPPRIIGDILVLHGFCIDEVIATSLPGCTNSAIFEWDNPTWFEYLGALVAIASPEKLSQLYTTPAPAVLCRTLIANSIYGSPAPNTIELSFFSWLIYMTGRPGSNEDLTGQPDSAKWRSFTGLLSALATLIKGALRNTQVPWTTLLDEVLEFVALLTAAPSHDPRRAAAIASLNQGLTAFNMEHGMHIGERKLLRTSKGLLGLGPASTEPGDEVWAIENAQMVMVLRRTHSEDGVQRMSFVGDGYLHGCMRGELFEALGIDTSSREVYIS